MSVSAAPETERLEASLRDFVVDGVVAMIVVQHNRPRFANAAAARLFGYATPDAITALDSVGPLYVSHERDRIRDYGERRRRGGPAPERYEVECLRADGVSFRIENHVYWTRWEGAPASAVVMIDITARKDAEDALSRSEQRFRDFADMGSDWLWEMDAELRYTYISPRYEEITGRPPGRLIGKTRREMYGGRIAEERGNWEGFFATLEAHRDFDDFVYTNWDEDGRPLTLSNSGRAQFDEDGRFLGYRGIGRDLTAQVAAETRRDEATAEAQRARQQLADSIEGINDAFILYDAADRLVLCNERYRDLYPYLPPKDQLAGKTFEELIRLGIEHGVVDEPEIRANPEAWVRRRLETHRNATGQPILQHWSDGRVILIREWRTREGGIVGIRSDITALQRAEQRLLDAIESLDEGFVLWDADERMVLCNERYRDFNRHVAELLVPGVQFETVLRSAIAGTRPADEVKTYVGEYMREFRAGRERRFEWRIPDGRWVMGRERRTSEGGVVGLRTDITVLKNREIELSDARERAEQAAELLAERSRELERSNRDLEDFAHVASHDLKEPLRKIIAFGERLTSKYGDKLDEDGRYYVDRMAAASRRMQELITGLLNYARIGRSEGAFRRVDLREVAERVVEDLEVRIQEKGGTVQISGAGEVEGDPGLIHRLILNLIGNGLKFHRPDVPPEVNVTIEAVTGDRRRQSCRIRVADKGIGFDPAASARIFRPFQRLHSRDVYDGTGIGLAIVKRIVEHHGGMVTAESDPRTGTTFTVDLPAAQRRSDPLTPPEAERGA